MRPIDGDKLQKVLENILMIRRNFGANKLEISTLQWAIDIVKNQPNIAPPPNDSLTLEELREMEGTPVWVERYDDGHSRYAIVGDFKSLYGVYFGTAQGGLRLPYDEYGKTWLAYRRKPEEAT